MSFREKSAWISLVCLVATFGLFFGAMAHGLIDVRGVRTLTLFFACIAIFVVLQIVLHVAAAATTPRDGKAVRDEREQLIGFKATRNANIALVIGVLMVPGSQHLGVSAPFMAYLAMLALVFSELVRAVSRIMYFRRDR
jgi:hypothetical protein